MTLKVTIMVLKVDLQCSSCYKKVKKVLCKFPQIRDQIYDEKGNTVTITVVCCNPEKIRDKLCCKGAKAIKSIDIKEPPKPKDKPPAEKPVEKPKADPEKPKDKPPAEKPVEKPQKPNPPKKPDPPPAPVPVPAPRVLVPVNFCEPVHGCPPAYPTGSCCWQCSEGYGGGPCYERPVPPPPGPCYSGYGYGYGYGGYRRYGSRCDYFIEENPQGCTIM